MDASDGGTFNTINPTTEEVICKVAKGTAQDVDLAVNAAEVTCNNITVHVNLQENYIITITRQRYTIIISRKLSMKENGAK